MHGGEPGPTRARTSIFPAQRPGDGTRGAAQRPGSPAVDVAVVGLGVLVAVATGVREAGRVVLGRAATAGVAGTGSALVMIGTGAA